MYCYDKINSEYPIIYLCWDTVWYTLNIQQSIKPWDMDGSLAMSHAYPNNIWGWYIITGTLCGLLQPGRGRLSRRGIPTREPRRQKTLNPPENGSSASPRIGERHSHRMGNRISWQKICAKYFQKSLIYISISRGNILSQIIRMSS